MSTVLSGQDILDRIQVRLGGLANAFTVEQLLSFAEDGTQEVWAVLKSFGDDYFGDSSQDSDSTTTDTFFADLTPAAREYPLPPGCREIRAIECLTANFEFVKFHLTRFESPDFQRWRRASTQSGTNRAGGFYHYCVFGNKFMLAEFPEAVLNVRLWYIKSLNVLTVDTTLDDILYPFSGKIVDYAVQKAMVSARQLEMTEEWAKQWRQSVTTLGESAGPRSSTGPIFIDDYEGV